MGAGGGMVMGGDAQINERGSHWFGTCHRCTTYRLLQEGDDEPYKCISFSSVMHDHHRVHGHGMGPDIEGLPELWREEAPTFSGE